MIRIVHCADVHLDSPFVVGDPRNAELKRMEIRSTFTSFMMHAKNFGARLILISGDLFDDNYVSKDTANLLMREMASFSECRFFISPGDSDFYHSKSPYKMMKWSDNVHIFKSNDMTRIEIPELNVDVYGYAFTDRILQTSPFANRKPQNPSRINILVGHGDIAPNSLYCSVSKGDVERSGFDYIALGHIHDATDVIRINETYLAYPGCLEGKNFDELGDKGAILGEIDKGRCNLKHVKFSKKKYEAIEVDISQYITETQILDAIKLAMGTFREETALRVDLTGTVRPNFTFNPVELEKKITGVHFVQLRNKTRPYIDVESLRRDRTVKGIFFKKLEDKLNSSDEKEREQAKSSLRYGLNSFASLDIIDF